MGRSVLALVLGIRGERVRGPAGDRPKLVEMDEWERRGGGGGEMDGMGGERKGGGRGDGGGEGEMEEGRGDTGEMKIEGERGRGRQNIKENDHRVPHSQQCQYIPVLIELYGKISNALKSLVSEGHVGKDLSSATHEGSSDLHPLTIEGRKPFLKEQR